EFTSRLGLAPVDEGWHGIQPYQTATGFSELFEQLDRAGAQGIAGRYDHDAIHLPSHDQLVTLNGSMPRHDALTTQVAHALVAEQCLDDMYEAFVRCLNAGAVGRTEKK